MKMVVAVIRPERLQTVKDGLSAIGVCGMTITHVTGRGEQKGLVFTTRVGEFIVDEIEKTKIEIVVDDDSLSSYRGQLVVDEYTKEPTGLRYKDDHLYDDDGHDLGSFSDLGNFYPNR